MKHFSKLSMRKRIKNKSTRKVKGGRQDVRTQQEKRIDEYFDRTTRYKRKKNVLKNNANMPPPIPLTPAPPLPLTPAPPLPLTPAPPLPSTPAPPFAQVKGGWSFDGYTKLKDKKMSNNFGGSFTRKRRRKY